MPHFSLKIFFATLFSSLALSASVPAAELLLNGNFEGPVVTADGNHIGTLPTSWTVASPNTPTVADASLSNLNRGVVTSGTGVTSPNQYLQVCPDDTSANAAQSLDGNGANVVVFQTFTPATTLNTPIEIKIDFGGRDSDSASAATTGSSWQLINTATNAVLASAAVFKPATGTWIKSDVVTGTLTLSAGVTYKFQVFLDNPDHIDAASITTVPEPSTLAALGGLLLAGGCVRLARARRQA